MKFCYFIIISPWKWAGPFIWTNFNPFYSRMICAKFGWNWLSGFLRRRFLNFVNVFSQFRNYLLLGKGGALHFNKFETPSPNDALCQVWLKLAQWFWRRRWKCEKFTTTTTTTMTTTTTTMNNGQILIRKPHLSLRLRWAKKIIELPGKQNMPFWLKGSLIILAARLCLLQIETILIQNWNGKFIPHFTRGGKIHVVLRKVDELWKCSLGNSIWWHVPNKSELETFGKYFKFNQIDTSHLWKKTPNNSSYLGKMLWMISLWTCLSKNPLLLHKKNSCIPLQIFLDMKNCL